MKTIETKITNGQFVTSHKVQCQTQVEEVEISKIGNIVSQLFETGAEEILIKKTEADGYIIIATATQPPFFNHPD